MSGCDVMLGSPGVPFRRETLRRETSSARGPYLAADRRMLEIEEQARRVAGTTAPVLITGESGVGKEVLARFVHARSPRAGRSFVKINCAAVPHDLLESELFGHERGAFTGAYQRKEGTFEAADGGTLLLDEIGDMSLALQAKLLHVLEDLTFTRVGGTQPVRIDARIVATTNKPLEEAVAQGEFRKDLFFRLNVIRFEIPPLRERKADIPLLAEHFLRKHADGHDLPPGGFPERLLGALLRYSWPGNVRELEHVIQRYVILPDVGLVEAELLMPGAGETVAHARANGHGHGHGHGHGAFHLTVEVAHPAKGPIPLKIIAAKAAEEAEKTVILQVLRETRWNRRRAAARLDVCYKTLLNKLHRWELEGDEGAA